MVTRRPLQGLRLRVVVAATGMSRAQVAAELGVSYTHLSRVMKRVDPEHTLSRELEQALCALVWARVHNLTQILEEYS